jgi:uncharacterized membrane protein YobD (UPF0266 family)
MSKEQTAIIGTSSSIGIGRFVRDGMMVVAIIITSAMNPSSLHATYLLVVFWLFSVYYSINYISSFSMASS